MAKLLGDGMDVIDVGIDARDQEIESLKQERRSLQRALADAKLEATRAREDADRGLSSLRRQLSPLYRALQLVFGELDAAGVTESAPIGHAAPAPSGGGMDARVVTLWTEWKSRVSPSAARVIDALMIHGDLTIDQICVAAKMGRNTVYDVLKQLKKPALLVKNGGKFSLKAL